MVNTLRRGALGPSSCGPSQCHILHGERADFEENSSDGGVGSTSKRDFHGFCPCVEATREQESLTEPCGPENCDHAGRSQTKPLPLSLFLVPEVE